MINVALLSRWHVHANDYAREAKENKQLNIVQVWDEDDQRGKVWADELEVSFESELEAVLSNPEVDAVIVSAPTNMHKEIIEAAANHQKHIFTEKVLAFSVRECERILDVVEKQGVKLMVSLPRLTENDYLYAQLTLSRGWLGELTMIRCRLAHNGGVAAKGTEHGWLPARFYDKKATGGGALIDLGAHPIYLTNRLAGPAKAVYARLQPQTSKDVDDSASVIVEYDSGALGMIETGFLSHGSPFQLELYGTEGTLLIEDGVARLKSVHVNGDEWMQLEEDLPDVPKPMDQWVAAMASDAKPVITPEDVIGLTLINEAAAVSHDEGRRVEIIG